jgi:hypothetical protein
VSIETILYNHLIEVARAGKTIGRDEVAGLVGLNISSTSDRQELVRILDNIAYQENAAGRPLLSAIVVLPEIGYPGKAFFLVARELGLNNYGDDRSFYYYELKRVHEYWKNHQPTPSAIPYQKAIDPHTVLALR